MTLLQRGMVCDYIRVGSLSNSHSLSLLAISATVAHEKTIHPSMACPPSADADDLCVSNAGAVSPDRLSESGSVTACFSDPSFCSINGALSGHSEAPTYPLLPKNVADAGNRPDLRIKKLLTCTAGCRKRFANARGRTRHETIKHQRSRAPPGTSRCIKAEGSNSFRCPVDGCKMRLSCQALLNIHQQTLHSGRMRAPCTNYGPIKKVPEILS